MMNSATMPDDLNHINDVFNQYLQNKQSQQGGGLLQQILTNRMTPEPGDVMNSLVNTASSFGSSQFKPSTPEEEMASRIKNQLSPYSDALNLANAGETLSGNQMQNEIKARTGLPAAMAELQQRQMQNDITQQTGLPAAMAALQKAQTDAQYADPMAQADLALKQAHANYFSHGGGGGAAGGGATGALVSRLMADTGMSFEQALYAVQTGFRQGTGIGTNGQVSILQGVPEAKGTLKGAEQDAKNQSDLNYAAPTAAQTKIGEATGKAEGAIQTRAVNAPQMENLLLEAEQLLPQATGGGLQTQRRDALAYFGSATKGSKADARLNVIGAALTANVPRMEGPQSDYDVALYSKAAGDVANSKLPVETRLAAIKTIRDLNNKYSGQGAAPTNSGGFDIDSYLKEKGLQ